MQIPVVVWRSITLPVTDVDGKENIRVLSIVWVSPGTIFGFWKQKIVGNISR